MKLLIVYGVKTARGGLWLEDTCAGGAWTNYPDRALTFSTQEDALDALAAAELTHCNGWPLKIVPLIEEHA